MPESHRNLRWLVAILLVAGTALLYAPSARNGFVNYDDPDYVTRNPEVLRGMNWHGVVWSFSMSNPAANWHPLTWMSHMLDVSRYGTNPFGHHLTNLLLHCLGVLILFVFLERATGMALRSAAVAGLFAVHPLNVESVAWVAERKAVLCMVFLLLTLWAYVWYTKRPGIVRYLLVGLLFAFALMSKIMVVTLPFVMVLLDYWPLRRVAGPENEDCPFPPMRQILVDLKKSVIEKLPLFVMSAAGAFITLQIHRNEGALTHTMPLLWRLKNATFSYGA